MRRIAVRLALALVAAAALAWPPTRRLIADVLITVGAHLDHIDDPPELTPEQAARMHDAFADAVAAGIVKRQHDANGHRPAAI